MLLHLLTIKLIHCILQEEEQVPVTIFHYYDNKPTVDYLLLKPSGLFSVIDDATKGRQSHEFIVGM